MPEHRLKKTREAYKDKFTHYNKPTTPDKPNRCKSCGEPIKG